MKLLMCPLIDMPSTPELAIFRDLFFSEIIPTNIDKEGRFLKACHGEATDCTPAGARIELDVVRSIDPVSKKEIFTNVPDGYNANEDDDAHQCGDATPTIGTATVSAASADDTWTIRVNVSGGKFPLEASGVSIAVNGSSLSVSKNGNSYTATYKGEDDPTGDITVTATDSGYYTTSKNF